MKRGGIIRRRESLALYKSFNTPWFLYKKKGMSCLVSTLRQFVQMTSDGVHLSQQNHLHPPHPHPHPLRTQTHLLTLLRRPRITLYTLDRKSLAFKDLNLAAGILVQRYFIYVENTYEQVSGSMWVGNFMFSSIPERYFCMDSKSNPPPPSHMSSTTKRWYGISPQSNELTRGTTELIQHFRL